MLPPPPTSTLFPYTTLFRSMKDKARKPTATPGSEPRPAEGPDLPERWSVQRKTELVLRLLRGEALDAVSRESQVPARSEEHTSELQSRFDLVCRLLLEKKKK